MASALLLALCAAASVPADQPSVVLVIGAAGAPQYEAEFRRWADLWEAAAGTQGASVLSIGRGEPGAATDKDRLRAVLEGAASTEPLREPLWVVLIGHGTYDRREAKFNLRGPDVTEAEMAAWLAGVRRPVAFINCASSSGPFLGRLTGPDRIVVTATRSGDESNFARFGGYLAEAVADPAADLDKDGQVSLLEAFLTAGGRTEEFYKSEARLTTEHALLDDNGDGLGTPAGWFRGVRAVKRAEGGTKLDGARAHQFHLVMGPGERELAPEVRARRDELELAVATLRESKSTLPEDDYYRRLEGLMLQLGQLYRTETLSPGGPAAADGGADSSAAP